MMKMKVNQLMQEHVGWSGEKFYLSPFRVRLHLLGFSQKKVNDGKGTLSQNQFCFVLPLLVLSGKKSDP